MITKAEKKELRERLVGRWVQLLTADLDAEGFWEEVEEGWGDQTRRAGPSYQAEAEALVKRAQDWLRRLP